MLLKCINRIPERCWDRFFKLLFWLPDKFYLKIKFFLKMGYKLNLEEPKTYNEKLQWLKLYNRKKEISNYADKYKVREIIKKKFGEELLIPCYGVWNKFDMIQFESLPKKFVMKCTHDSGSVMICEDKNKFNHVVARKYFKKFLKRKFYKIGREWVYKFITPKIIVEELLREDHTNDLKDYKLFCFDGKVKIILVVSKRMCKSTRMKEDFFDENFQPINLYHGYSRSDEKIVAPRNLNYMKSIASKLSVGHPHIRIDFYEVNGKVYFSEVTFFSGSGFKPFIPFSWDIILGDWIILPNK